MMVPLRIYALTHVPYKRHRSKFMQALILWLSYKDKKLCIHDSILLDLSSTSSATDIYRSMDDASKRRIGYVSGYHHRRSCETCKLFSFQKLKIIIKLNSMMKQVVKEFWRMAASPSCHPSRRRGGVVTTPRRNLGFLGPPHTSGSN